MTEKIEGVVASVSDSGNLITNITAEQLAHAPRDERVSISCGGHETNCIFGEDHHEPESTLLAMIGPCGRLEMGIVGMNMSEMLGLRVGEPVIVKWE